MVGVVEPNANEFADRSDACADSLLRRNHGQRLRIERTQAVYAFRQQCIPRDVGYEVGNVAPQSVTVHQGRALLTQGSISQ
jgi:hypothetical protein